MSKQFRGGMGELLRQANRMQRRIEQRKQELESETFDAAVGGERVKATANGAGELVRIEVDPALLKEEDLAMVQDLIVAAANAALGKSREMVDAEISKISNGLSLPGIS